jgi:hypothetical protein
MAIFFLLARIIFLFDKNSLFVGRNIARTLVVRQWKRQSRVTAKIMRSCVIRVPPLKELCIAGIAGEIGRMPSAGTAMKRGAWSSSFFGVE